VSCGWLDRAGDGGYRTRRDTLPPDEEPGGLKMKRILCALFVGGVMGPGGWTRAGPVSAEAEAPTAIERPAVPERLAAPLAQERRRMVHAQIEFPDDGRDPVTRKDVLDALRRAPRHALVPPELARRAYDDTPLPIGYGQTISQPYIVAIMTELLEVKPGDKVLEIGTGSGYQAAVLAEITPQVYTVEIIRPLLERAQAALKELGYDTVKAKEGDGYLGWPEHAPYDGIIVTCAAGHLPPPLWEQLKPGGRIVIPIGGVYEVQRLVVATKQEDGSRTTRTVMPVRFVRLTRSAEEGRQAGGRKTEDGVIDRFEKRWYG
jgi:protein-L-isoaspartate(D-aspartate) O-methyltransferase